MESKFYDLFKRVIDNETKELRTRIEELETEIKHKEQTIVINNTFTTDNIETAADFLKQLDSHIRMNRN